MALGELREGLARGHDDVFHVKVGSGIGAGLVSEGSLPRGAQGCAGDMAHIATMADPEVVRRCGQTGCLEALAGASHSPAKAGSPRHTRPARILPSSPTAPNPSPQPMSGGRRCTPTSRACIS